MREDVAIDENKSNKTCNVVIGINKTYFVFLICVRGLVAVRKSK